jgi:O-antigen/teichoic acid export membrane protein
MIARLFRDSAVYAVGGLLSQGIAFLMFPFLAHVFNPHDYGVLDILALAAALINLTVALEIGQGLGREVSELHGDSSTWREYASSALIFTAAVYTIFAIVTLILAVPITHILLDNHTSPWLVRLEVVIVWVNGSFYVAQDQLRWHGRAAAYALVSVILAATTTLTTATLVLGFGVGVVGALIGQLAGTVCAGAVLLALSRRDYRLYFDRAKCWRMLCYSTPLVFFSMGVFLNSFGDRLAIQHELTLAAVGVYGVAFRIATVVSLLLTGFQGSITPMLLARHAEPSTPQVLARIFRWFSAAGLCTFVGISIFADTEVRLLAARSYGGADVVVPYLVLQALLFGAYLFAPGLTITRRTRSIGAISMSAGIVNLALAFALVPSMGIRGAGVATLASSAWFFALNMWGSQRTYRVPHQWRRLLAALVVAIGSVIVSRDLLAQGGNHALASASLAAKGIITIGTVVLICALLTESWEIKELRDHIRVVLRRRMTA